MASPGEGSQRYGNRWHQLMDMYEALRREMLNEQDITEMSRAERSTIAGKLTEVARVARRFREDPATGERSMTMQLKVGDWVTYGGAVRYQIVGIEDDHATVDNHGHQQRWWIRDLHLTRPCSADDPCEVHLDGGGCRGWHLRRTRDAQLVVDSDHRRQASALRRIADELDPPVDIDPRTPVVYVSLYRDGQPIAGQRLTLACVGDGWTNGHMVHEGAIITDTQGVPLRRERYTIQVRRVAPENGD